VTTPLPMTRGRRLALLAGVPVVLVFIGWIGFSEVAFAGIGSYRVRLDVPVHGPKVRLGVAAADVRVTQAAGDRLRMTGKASYSLVRSTVDWQRIASGVNVYSHCPVPAGVCSVSLQAVVPAGKRVFISGGSGDLTLEGLSGGVNASDDSGDISGSALSGTAAFQSGSGDITIGGLTSANVAASDSSGDVTLTFTKVPDRVVVSSESGDITLVLPPGRTLYRVSATTSSGSRVVSVPVSSASPHAITVTDDSGDIAITN
jgi:Putative adhesin